MYVPILVTAPTQKCVSLAEAKKHIRVDDTDSDALIQGYIDAAISLIDGYKGSLGRCLEQQTWSDYYDQFDTKLRINLAPVIDIASVKYNDSNGVSQTVNSSNYQVLVDELGPYVLFNQSFVFPTTQIGAGPPVSTTYDAGYAWSAANGSTVPAAIRLAIKYIVGHWYESRESVITGLRAAAIEVPFTYDALIAPYRRVGF